MKTYHSCRRTVTDRFKWRNRAACRWNAQIMKTGKKPAKPFAVGLRRLCSSSSQTVVRTVESGLVWKIRKAILNQQNSHLGNCFILLSKIYSFYFCNMQEETKSQVLKLTENILNVKVENYSKKNLNFKKINKSIDNKNFFILGINLKEIFYSGYLFTSW